MTVKPSKALRDALKLASGIKGLAVRQDAHGLLQWRWIANPSERRAGFTGIQLGTDVEEAVRKARARNDEIAAWRSGASLSGAVRPHARRNTIAALIDLFRRTHLPRCKPTTQRTYGTALNRIEPIFGTLMVNDLDDHHVWAFRDALLETNLGPDAVHGTLRVLRTLFKFAEAQKWRAKGTNPATEFNMPTPPPRDVIIWPHLREALVNKADTLDEGGGMGVGDAIIMGFAIGQREADLLALSIAQWRPIPRHKIPPEHWAVLVQDAADGKVWGIRLRQGKTNAWIEVPVVGTDRNRIEAAIARARAAHCMTLLMDERKGQPWLGDAGQTRFQRRFAAVRKACAIDAEQAGDATLAAEFRRVWFSDFRRTCVVHLGEMGLDAHLIAAITGHDIDETQRILKTYMPRTTGRAAAAIAISATRRAERQQIEQKEQQG